MWKWAKANTFASWTRNFRTTIVLGYLKRKYIICILAYNLFYCLARRAVFFLQLVEDHCKVELQSSLIFTILTHILIAFLQSCHSINFFHPPKLHVFWKNSTDKCMRSDLEGRRWNSGISHPKSPRADQARPMPMSVNEPPVQFYEHCSAWQECSLSDYIYAAPETLFQPGKQNPYCLLL